MEPIQNGIALTGTLYTIAGGEAEDKLAYTDQIYDTYTGYSQRRVNEDTSKSLEVLSDDIVKLQGESIPIVNIEIDTDNPYYTGSFDSAEVIDKNLFIASVESSEYNLFGSFLMVQSSTSKGYYFGVFTGTNNDTVIPVTADVTNSGKATISFTDNIDAKFKNMAVLDGNGFIVETQLWPTIEGTIDNSDRNGTFTATSIVDRNMFILKLKKDSNPTRSVIMTKSSDGFFYGSYNNSAGYPVLVSAATNGTFELINRVDGRITDLEDSVGQVNGIAPLDSNAKVPVANLPVASSTANGIITNTQYNKLASTITSINFYNRANDTNTLVLTETPLPNVGQVSILAEGYTQIYNSGNNNPVFKTIVPEVSTSVSGLMLAKDKTKLDALSGDLWYDTEGALAGDLYYPARNTFMQSLFLDYNIVAGTYSSNSPLQSMNSKLSGMSPVKILEQSAWDTMTDTDKLNTTLYIVK